MSVQDKQLADKIRNVFESFEDDSSENGWAELCKKYPEKGNRKFVFWLSSVLLLALAGFGIWYYSPDAIKPAARPKLLKADTSSLAPGIELETKGDHVKPKPDSIAKDNLPVLEASPRHAATKTDKATNQINRPQKLLTVDEVQPVRSQDAAFKNKEVTVEPSVKPGVLIPVGAAEPARQPEALHSVNEQTDNNTFAPVTQSTPTLRDTVKLVFPRSASQKRRGLFSVQTSGYYNYTSGSQGTFNAGAGVGYELRLFRSLSLNTGAILQPTRFMFNGDLPVRSPQKFNSNPQAAFIAGNNSTVSAVDVRFLAVDIPLNLKYLVSPASPISFSAGLSSYLLLNEQYSYHINNPAVAGVETLIEKSNSVSLAASFNLSSGFRFPLSKSETMLLEPFIKIPLKGIGKKNIYYGSTGLHLKLSFPTYVQK